MGSGCVVFMSSRAHLAFGDWQYSRSGERTSSREWDRDITGLKTSPEMLAQPMPLLLPRHLASLYHEETGGVAMLATD